MVQKYFHKANISLNKLLQWNDLVKKCTVVKLGGHKLVQHVCSIGNSRLMRPKHPPHVAPTYDPNSLKSLVFLTNWLFTHLTMDNSKMLWYEKIWVIIIQSKPSIAHSSVVEKPSLVDKSWATNCFYVVKALNSGKPSVVDNFFQRLREKFKDGLGSS